MMIDKKKFISDGIPAINGLTASLIKTDPQLELQSIDPPVLSSVVSYPDSNSSLLKILKMNLKVSAVVEPEGPSDTVRELEIKFFISGDESSIPVFSTEREYLFDTDSMSVVSIQPE